MGFVIIAEISANHHGELDKARTLIRMAKGAGADFVKFQHYTPETITVQGNHSDLQISGGTIWDGSTTWELYSQAMTPWEWTHKLVDFCRETGIRWLSTPFDESAVDFLEQFSPEAYKIASFEIIDLPLIRHVARTGKPLIISTGMASLEEIDSAISEAERAGASDITVLRTNSAYPSSIEEMDLSAIPFMKSRWGYPVGLSDHTIGTTSALVAVGLGATVFEKHIIMARGEGGPDAAFSSEPDEFKTYVTSISDALRSLGTVRFGPSKREEGSLRFRPSLRAVEDIREGQLFTSKNVKSVRPSGGLAPDSIGLVLTKVAKRDIPMGEPITDSDISE